MSNKSKITNPLSLHGLKYLFTLQNLEVLKLQDHGLERKIEALKQEEYPDLMLTPKNARFVKMDRVLHHVNAALAASQRGKKVNEKLLTCDVWYMDKEFPQIEG